VAFSGVGSLKMSPPTFIIGEESAAIESKREDRTRYLTNLLLGASYLNAKVYDQWLIMRLLSERLAVDSVPSPVAAMRECRK
jgi:hypothetical protein